MKLVISLAQIDIELGKPLLNVERAHKFVREAASQGSDLVLFPELWSTGYDLDNWELHATGLDEGVFELIRGFSKDYKIAVGGSLLEKYNERAYNTFVLFGSGGNFLAAYRKIHLFRLMEEDQWLTGGEELVIADKPWGPVGLAICYDLRFPEMFRTYAVSGVPLTLVVAEWPEKRIEHWRVLLRARAIENQMYIAAVNRVGESKGEIFGGFSAIVDPWGELLVEGDDAESLITAEIDLGKVGHIRKLIPVMDDRRAEIYGLV